MSNIQMVRNGVDIGHTSVIEICVEVEWIQLHHGHTRGIGTMYIGMNCVADVEHLVWI